MLGTGVPVIYSDSLSPQLHLLGSLGPKAVRAYRKDGYRGRSDGQTFPVGTFAAAKVELRITFAGGSSFLAFGCEKIFMAGRKADSDIANIGSIFAKVGLLNLL